MQFVLICFCCAFSCAFFTFFSCILHFLCNIHASIPCSLVMHMLIYVLHHSWQVWMGPKQLCTPFSSYLKKHYFLFIKSAYTFECSAIPLCYTWWLHINEIISDRYKYHTRGKRYTIICRLHKKQGRQWRSGINITELTRGPRQTAIFTVSVAVCWTLCSIKSGENETVRYKAMLQKTNDTNKFVQGTVIDNFLYNANCCIVLSVDAAFEVKIGKFSLGESCYSPQIQRLLSVHLKLDWKTQLLQRKDTI